MRDQGGKNEVVGVYPHRGVPEPLDARQGAAGATNISWWKPLRPGRNNYPEGPGPYFPPLPAVILFTKAERGPGSEEERAAEGGNGHPSPPRLVFQFKVVCRSPEEAKDDDSNLEG